VKENLTLECHFSESLDVRAECDKYEAGFFAAQPKVEKKAMELYRSDKSAAKRYLTDYSRAVALSAVNKTRELTKQFK